MKLRLEEPLSRIKATVMPEVAGLWVTFNMWCNSPKIIFVWLQFLAKVTHIVVSTMIILNQGTGQTLKTAIPWSGVSLPHCHLMLLVLAAHNLSLSVYTHQLWHRVHTINQSITSFVPKIHIWRYNLRI
jgi:hypothetical protein